MPFMNEDGNLSGLFLVDKQAGPSSAKTLHILKNTLNLSRAVKIGHAGTLDPFATGLLIVLIGKACRLADLFQAQFKTYSGKIRLGLVTDSDDITGNVIKKTAPKFAFKQVEESAKSFLGEIEQLPPAISALNINGRRAYEMVRSGETPVIKSRKVTLQSISLTPIDNELVGFSIRCSKGFYVRAMARDIGEKLGCGGCLQDLRREESMPFSVESARPAEELQITDLIAMDQALNSLNLPEVLLGELNYNKLRQGLISEDFKREFLPKLDSGAQGLLVYRREEDRSPGGLLCASEGKLSIRLNF